ncbi:hypothetical protein DAEQUDRAFT_756368 [Daedalea quercina L-15889]|uniref:C2H2-type domain-containing protein n=1 Tax=Daedalea quercina L-15889 TaxID=1314783 RepID=A0A165R9R9_9APHY|nr:hypothetical protein DAEQUDRAFT_756368 [Daedalea quercina L-15889]
MHPFLPEHVFQDNLNPNGYSHHRDVHAQDGIHGEPLPVSYAATLHPSMHTMGSSYAFAPQHPAAPAVSDDHYGQQYGFTSHISCGMVVTQPSPTSRNERYGDWQTGQPELYAPTTFTQSQSYHAHHQAPSPGTVYFAHGDDSQYPPTQPLPIHPAPITYCAWDGGSCGAPLDDVSPAGIARHLRTCHFRGNWQPRSRGRCCWGAGCRGDEMNYESMGKHVAQVHLQTTKRQCQRCGGTFARNDALLRHLREHCES